MKKRNKKIVGKVPKPGNPVHVATFERGAAGAGSHTQKGYNRKQKHKRNNDD